jgi:hypothetical protein
MAYKIFGVGNSAGETASLSLDSDGTVAVGSNSLTTAILSKLVGLGGFIWDLTGATTGAAYVGLTANLASALAFKVGATAWLTFKTTTDAERITLAYLRADAATVTATIAADHTLVLGTAAANQTKLTGQVVLLNNTSGATKNLTLPSWASIANVPIDFINISANDVALLDSTGGAAGTVAAGKGAMLRNNGTIGGAILGA